MPTKRRRITRSFPFTNQKTDISMQLGSLRTKPCKKHFHTRNEQPEEPRQNPVRNTTICTSPWKRTRKSTKNDKHKHKYNNIKPIVRENTIYKTSKQGPHSPNTPIRSYPRLPTLRQKIPPEPSKRMPRKERSMQNMQKDRPFRKTLQIRNAPTITIQYATTTTTKLIRPTKLFRSSTTKQKQRTGYEKDTTENEKHKWRGIRWHTRHSRRNNRSRINLLNKGNDGRLAKHNKLHSISTVHEWKS